MVLRRTVILETVLELFCTFLIILGDLSFIGDRNDILHPTHLQRIEFVQMIQIFHEKVEDREDNLLRFEFPLSSLL